MSNKKPYDEVLSALMAYRIRAGTTSDFEVMEQIIKALGWDWDAFHAEFQERQAFLKLQGKI